MSLKTVSWVTGKTVRGLLCRHEDLSSDPGTHIHENMETVACICNSKGGDRWATRSHCRADCWVLFSERPCLQHQGGAQWRKTLWSLKSCGYVGGPFFLKACWPPVYEDKGQKRWQRTLYSLWARWRQLSRRQLRRICSTLFQSAGNMQDWDRWLENHQVCI